MSKLMCDTPFKVVKFSTCEISNGKLVYNFEEKGLHSVKCFMGLVVIAWSENKDLV